MKKLINEEFKRMQLLAGIITESQLNETEAKDAASIIKAIDAKLKAKNLKGMPSTNIQNPEKDIKDKEVDYVTITYKADAGDVVSVYIKDTPENKVLAKEIETEFGGKFFTGNANGTVLGVSQIPSSAKSPTPTSESTDIEKSVNEGMPVGKSKLAQELAPKLNIYIGKIQNPKLENEAMVHASKIIELIDKDSEMGESIEQSVNEALKKYRKNK